MIIEKIYIDSARNIRSEYLKLSSKLDSYKKELSQLVLFLEQEAKNLEKISKNKVKYLKNNSEASELSEELVKRLTNIEIEEQRLLKLIKPINDKMDKLREEENELYHQLKEKYPKMSDDDMRKEIQSQLEK